MDPSLILTILIVVAIYAAFAAGMWAEHAVQRRKHVPESVRLKP